jgi:hypothetical protein
LTTIGSASVRIEVRVVGRECAAIVTDSPYPSAERVDHQPAQLALPTFDGRALHGIALIEIEALVPLFGFDADGDLPLRRAKPDTTY